MVLKKIKILNKNKKVLFLNSKIVLTITFYIDLMYNFGDIENQSSNFCNFRLFFQGMKFYDDVKDKSPPFQLKNFQIQI